ncbi:MAG: hypothetical protein MJ007_00255 [Paludibacteraceae bacterium]|nr:hypothetical protein [Paludibacteraceae bacterium]
MLLFKIRKPRQYNVKYRYYDEHKERLQQSEARVRKKLGMDVDDSASTGVLHRGVFRNSIDSTKEEKSRNMRFGIIIGVLLIFAYCFIHYAG